MRGRPTALRYRSYCDAVSGTTGLVKTAQDRVRKDNTLDTSVRNGKQNRSVVDTNTQPTYILYEDIPVHTS